MRFFYPVSLILFVTISIATPPPGYVKPPNDDKDPPSYQYAYEIGNADGKSQGKMETRSGELASGRYYVNAEKSSTDVKYYADEWGYHPLVKYRAANDHSLATTHFALGEHVVKSLLNGTEVGEEVKLPASKIHQNDRKPVHRRRRPMQLVQTYTPSIETEIAASLSDVGTTLEAQPIDDTSAVNSLSNYDNQRTSGNEFDGGSRFQQNFNNFVGRDSSTVISTSESPFSESTPDSREVARSEVIANDLFSTIPDDALFVENAGSFGRRLKPSGNSKEHLLTRAKFSSTMKNSQESSRLHFFSTTESVRESSSTSATTPRATTVSRNEHSIANSDFLVSTTEIPSEPSIDETRNWGETVSAAYSGFHANTNYYSKGERDRGLDGSVDSAVSSSRFGKNNSSGIRDVDHTRAPGSWNYGKRLDQYSSQSSEVESSTPGTLSTFSSKPIIVAELASYKPDEGIEYSTTFPCKDEKEENGAIAGAIDTSFGKDSEAGVLVTVKQQLQTSHGHLTTSPAVLNPIQAGVSLVNANETEVIRSENQIAASSLGGVVPAPIKNPSDELTKPKENEQQRPELYETIYPFGQSTFDVEKRPGGGNTGLPSEKLEDQLVEIQKSVEIYQNAPVHEIHYPPEVIEQVSEVEHHRQEVKLLPEDETRNGYVELQNAGNAKQFDSLVDVYNGEEAPRHESHGTQLSLENIRDASLIGGSVYHGNLVRQDNELLDYPIERNNGLSSVLPERDEDGKRIIKLIRDGIPEVKYTSAKIPNVKLYSTSEADNAREWQQQEASDHNEERTNVDSVAHQSQSLQSQLQKILESESVRNYFSGGEWSKGNDENRHRDQYEVRENVDESETRLQQQQQQEQSMPWAQSYEASSPRSIEENRDVSSRTLQQSTTAERIVEKTIHVPQPYPVEVPRIIEKKVPYTVEKIVEKKVPYPVEKIIEKKIPVPQPYPVHIPVDRVVEKQVQILQPYPVHIEKVIEKKVPYPVQRLVPHPYPVHILQPYPVEKIIEKPVHIPVTVEKIVEKKVHVPAPYPVQIPIKVPYPVEITKYVENSVQVPYGVRYGVSYQQIMKPPSKGLYGSHGSLSVPLYGLSLVSNRDRDRPNVTQPFQGYTYEKPAIPFESGERPSWNSHGRTGLEDRQQAPSKKSYFGYVEKLPSLAYPGPSYSSNNRRHAAFRSNGPLIGEQSGIKNEYVGPVPSLKSNLQLGRLHNSADHQSLKQQTTRSASSNLQSPSRRSRQQENPPQYQTGPGAFRQSKIEYGFKPPMVPSVQYDEKTASKVDN